MTRPRLPNAQPITQVIKTAEKVRDPLVGLVESTSKDPGAPFDPEVLTALAALRDQDRARYEKRLAELKRAGCRITELEKALPRKAGGEVQEDNTHVARLLRLAEDDEFFRTPEGDAFADVEVDGHRETLPVRGKEYRQLMQRRYFKRHGSAPSPEARTSALETIEAMALAEGEERQVYLRVAPGCIDLGDDPRRAVKISADGWKAVSRPKVRFRRTTSTQALPVPRRGGDIMELRRFLNVKSDGDFKLAIAWMVAALMPDGPYPVLIVTGEQGTAKSTFLEIVRLLIDPNAETLPGLPRNEDDLAVKAQHRHLLAFDNVSLLLAWICDALCRIAYGGTFSKRQLYADRDEVLLHACAPIIINGIGNVAVRGDLIDRAIVLELAPIPKKLRREKKELMAEFEEARPRILGALLDIMVQGLRNLPDVSRKNLARMADFHALGRACDEAIGGSITFDEAYARNQEKASESVLDADPIAQGVLLLMEDREKWQGTSSALLRLLTDQAEPALTRDGQWPRDPARLGRALTRAAPLLREQGIEIGRRKSGRESARLIVITKGADGADGADGKFQLLDPAQKKKSQGLNGQHHRFRKVSPDALRARINSRINQKEPH